jgi:predicted Zn-dependent peptidase
VKELVVDSVMPEQELAIYKQNMQQRLKVNLRKCDFVASRLIDTYLFGADHPYGKFSTVEGFDSLNREELMDFYKEYYQQGKFIVFASGKLPSDLAALLDKWLGDLPNQQKAMPLITPVRAREKKYRVLNNEEGVQGAIRMARPFPNRHHPDFMKVMVLNTLFGGFFGSRLMSNIREDKGYTYGIHSFLMNHVHESGWAITTEAGKDVCEAAISEVYKEMAILRDELVDEEELLLVRNYMLGGILGDLDGPFQIISRWKNIVLNGLTEQYFYDTIKTIKTISAEEIKELANKYLQPDEFYELVVI